MVWIMMAVDAAERISSGPDGVVAKSEAALRAFAIPDETDEEFADFMFSRKSDAIIDGEPA